MRNPDFLHAPPAKPDLRFKRFIKLGNELAQTGVLQWAADPREDVPFNILITDYAPVHSERVRGYLTLLGLPMPQDETKDIVLPVHLEAVL